MRRKAALVLAVGLMASLTACAGNAQPQTVDGCTPAASGSVSDGVKITGDFGERPEVDLGGELTVEETQRTVVENGDGEVVKSGDTVDVEFVLYNGTSGAELPGTEFSGQPAPFLVDAEQLLPGIVKALECSTIGSRVVAVIPPVDSFGDQGSAQLGVGPGDTIVFVADVVGMTVPPEPPLARAEGEAQEPVEGMPTVELDEQGAPTITLPDAEPPTELQLAVLIEGEGEEVPEGANVVVHYKGLNWNTGEIFDESWARGAPASFNSRQVIAGFTAALEGHKVGSQVLVVIPPAEGYGEAGQPAAGIGGEDTLVFVVDILGLE